MDSTSQTSFIPKKPISSGPISYESRGVSIVTIICAIIFFGAVALSVGSYLYRGILNKSLENKKETLEKARKGFEISTIEDLKRLDTRIETVKSLLEKHIAMSAYFSLLEEVTLKSVRFADFSISAVNTNTGAPAALSGGIPTRETPLQFEMKGIAKSYSSIALQSKFFTDAKKFRGTIVSDLDLDQFGNVNFNITASIDPSALRYREMLGLPQSNGSSAEPPVSTGSENTNGQQ